MTNEESQLYSAIEKNPQSELKPYSFPLEGTEKFITLFAAIDKGPLGIYNSYIGELIRRQKSGEDISVNAKMLSFTFEETMKGIKNTLEQFGSIYVKDENKNYLHQKTQEIIFKIKNIIRYNNVIFEGNNGEIISDDEKNRLGNNVNKSLQGYQQETRKIINELKNKNTPEEKDIIPYQMDQQLKLAFERISDLKPRKNKVKKQQNIFRNFVAGITK